MKREIRFRGLSVENKIWYFGDLQQNSIGDTWISELDCGEGDRGYFINVNPKTVGEFTGLKDKNGVEIYEGDIVMSTVTIKVEQGEKIFSYYTTGDDGKRQKVCCNPKPSVVKYGKSGYYFEHISGATKPFWVCVEDIESKFDIIGSIHQNPELLK